MIKLDSKIKYIVAVSGGSDSMALLNMAVKDNLDIVVAHVNYHARKSANRDTEIVKEYCEKHKIILEILNVKPLREGNFEAWAREIRYDFFKKVGIKYQTKHILVAHQIDDLLETYLLQKERGSIPLYYGLNKVSEFKDLIVIRPLLKYSKKDLEKYCLKNNINFGIDETNYINDYQRNRIRNEVLANKTPEEKKTIINDIKNDNKKLKAFKKTVRACLNNCFNNFNKYKYLKYNQEVRIESLRQYLIINGIDSRHFSNAHLIEIDHILLGSKNQLLEIDNKYFDYSYGKLLICEKYADYEYKLNKIKKFKTPYFEVTNQGDSLNAVTVDENDFPLIIRNAKDGDEIALRLGHKKLNRFFIDRKISLSERLKWPVVINNKGDVILIPGLGCDINHYSHIPNLFVLK